MALLLESLLHNTVAAFAAVLAMLYLYFTRNLNIWKKHRIPYSKP
jgi:hypothetical protein